MVTFIEKLEERWRKGYFVCVGLDSDYSRLPQVVKDNLSLEEALFHFNRTIVDTTYDLVCAYKPNSAFYEAYGEAGMRALKHTVAYIKERYEDIPVLLDAKRGDIGSTNRGYVAWAFDELQADAITVHPYLGREALEPFLMRKDKGIIVLAKTSNSGANEFQNLLVGDTGEPLYQFVARQVSQHWNTHGNCALVTGATYPEELRNIRQTVGDMPLLIPGIGAQGGDIVAAVQAGRDSRGWGMIISSSREIIYASTGEGYGQAARQAVLKLHKAIQEV